MKAKGSKAPGKPIPAHIPTADQIRMALQSSAINKKVAEIRRKNKGGG